MNFENYTLEGVKASIDGLNRRLEEIIKSDLSKISKQYDTAKNKLQNVDAEQSICPSCKQEIKDDEVKKHLKYMFEKEMDDLQEKADKLKERAIELNTTKRQKEVLYNKLNTLDAQELQREKEKLKERIDVLTREKENILHHNQQVNIKSKTIKDAKDLLITCEKTQKEILEQLELNRVQRKIADKLKILIIETQKEKIRKYLNKVDIEFSKFVKLQVKLQNVVIYNMKEEISKNYLNLNRQEHV